MFPDSPVSIARRMERAAMIISHKYRYIFLKTNKTAGTSLEIALSQYCGDDDIITPISPEDEDVRRELGFRGPQNYLVPLSKHSLGEWLKLPFKGRNRFFNHIGARQVKEWISPDIWNHYYKFCFERNPFDRVISFYYWRHKTEPRPPISEAIASGEIKALREKGYNLYTIDGKVVVDRVCLYEKMAAELVFLTQKLQLPGPLTMPKTKNSFRPANTQYAEILDAASIKKISECFAEEIQMCGYKPGA